MSKYPLVSLIDIADSALSPALLAYEHLLTWKDELDLVWRRKMGIVSWIFLANRAILAAFVLEYALSTAKSVSSTADSAIVECN